MNTKVLKRGGSIYDTLYVAQISRGGRDQPAKSFTREVSLYDASQARFSQGNSALIVQSRAQNGDSEKR